MVSSGGIRAGRAFDSLDMCEPFICDEPKV